MTPVSYKVFKKFVEENNLTKVYYQSIDDWIFGFTLINNYIDSEGEIMAIEEEDRNWQIESQEAENLNTLEFVANLIKVKQQTI